MRRLDVKGILLALVPGATPALAGPLLDLEVLQATIKSWMRRER